jgi:Peptidase M50B-like
VGYGSVKLQTIAAYALSWFLLLSGVRFVLMHRSGAVDAGILRGVTHVPRIVWAALWLVITVIALWAGGCHHDGVVCTSMRSTHLTHQ